jgi:hypothetical protein
LKEEVMNYSNEKKVIKELRVLLFLAVLFAAFMIVTGISKADAIDYVDNNYTGTISKDAGADMFTEPGTVKPHLTDADGNNVHVDYGTEVLIYKEEYDADLDMWYYCTATVDGVEYTGYVYSGRITRGDPIAHTPTPTPTISPDSPTPETATSGNIQSGDIYSDNTGLSDDTQSMVESSNSFKPWTYIILICIVIVAFMLIYTLYVKFSEEKLEREIERYSNRPQYEPLEGEAVEDFEEAKSNYYDSIGLGAQANKDYDDLLTTHEDMDLNIDKLYEDQNESEEFSTTAYSKKSTLDELLASLEEKLGDAEAIDDSDEDVYGDSDEDFTSEYTDEELAEFAKYEEAEENEESIEENNEVEQNYTAVDADLIEDADENDLNQDDFVDADEDVNKETDKNPDLKSENHAVEAADLNANQIHEQAEASHIEIPNKFKKGKKHSAPVKKQEQPVKKQEQPVKKQEAPAKKQEQPLEKQESSVKKQESAKKPARPVEKQTGNDKAASNGDGYSRTDMSAAQLAFRNKLDTLSPKDLIRHKVYGNGVVVENKDALCLVVKFADGSIKYLDKDKITIRHLVQISKK